MGRFGLLYYSPQGLLLPHELFPSEEWSPLSVEKLLSLASIHGLSVVDVSANMASKLAGTIVMLGITYGFFFVIFLFVFILAESFLLVV